MSQQAISFVPVQQTVSNDDGPSLPPMRVLVAMRFLDAITRKLTPRICPIGEFRCETIDGLSLTPTEVNAQKHACDLLIDYFRGDLKPNALEAIELRGLRQDLQASANEVTRPMIRCPACTPGQPEEGCKMCGGSGFSIVSPSNGR